MARYIGALLLAALVLWTGEARGACAWVLWEGTEYTPYPIPTGWDPTSKSWRLHVARQTQGECEDVLTKVWQVTLNQWQLGPDKPGIKEVRSAPGYIALTFQGKDGQLVSSSSMTFLCLPDTIDPRTPKEAK